MTALVAEGERGGVARALVLVDIVPRIEVDGVEKIGAFMGAAPTGFESLEEVADAVAAYQPHRKRPSNIEGLRRNVRLAEDGRLYWHWDPAFQSLGDDTLVDRDNHYERLADAARSIACADAAGARHAVRHRQRGRGGRTPRADAPRHGHRRRGRRAHGRRRRQRDLRRPHDGVPRLALTPRFDRDRHDAIRFHTS